MTLPATRCGSKLVSGYGVLMYSSYFPKSGYAVLIPVLMYSSYFPKIRLCGTHPVLISGTSLVLIPVLISGTHLRYSSLVLISGTLLRYSTSVLYSGTLLSAAGENFGVLCSGTLIRYLEIVRYSTPVLYSGTLLRVLYSGTLLQVLYSGTLLGYSTPGMSAAGEFFLLLCSGSLVWYFEIVLYLSAAGEKK